VIESAFMPTSLPRIAGLALILFSLSSRASAERDPEHCGALVFVDGLRAWPSQWVSVSVTPTGAWRSTAIGAYRTVQVDSDRVAEFAALPTGTYLMHVGGWDSRPLPNWQPPPVSTYRTADGRVVLDNLDDGPPMQICKFNVWKRWTVRRGDCADSLRVSVRAKKHWVNVEPGQRVVLPSPDDAVPKKYWKDLGITKAQALGIAPRTAQHSRNPQ
jgi:hypothetical protein